jgi:hypothetical protein
MAEFIRRRWNWLDSGALPLASVLMYIAWFYPLLAVFMGDPSTGVRAPGVALRLCLVVLPAAILAGHLTKRSCVGVGVVLVGGLAAIVLSLAWVVQALVGQAARAPAALVARVTGDPRGTWVIVPLVVALIAAVYLWSRGVSIARTDYRSVSRSFTIGAVVLSGLFFLALLLPLSSRLAQVESEPNRTLRTLLHLAEGIMPLSVLVFQVCILFALLSIGLGSIIGEPAAALGEWTIPIGLLFLALVSPMAISVETLAGPVLLFMISGLVALSLLRVSRTVHVQERRTGLRLCADGHWIAIVLVVVGGILLLGLLSGRILAPILFAIRHFLAGLPKWALLDWPVFPWPFARARSRDAMQIAEELPLHSRRFLDAILLVGMVLTIALMFLKREWIGKLLGGFGGAPTVTECGVVTERRENIFSWDLLLSQLRALLRRLRAREEPPPPFLPLDPSADPRQFIRALYQRLLVRAIELDLPRQTGETPRTYMVALLDLCPRETAALETLTSAYVAARYGTRPPSRQQVQATLEAFSRIDAALCARFGLERTDSSRS